MGLESLIGSANPIGLGMQIGGGLIGTFSKLLMAGKQKKMAKEYEKNRPKYQISPYAKNNLALANNMFNGRMAGAAQAQNNIYQNQANAFQNVARGATSGSQMLAAAAGLQGQTDNSLNNLATAEAQNKANNAGMVMQANDGMTNELSKQFQDQLSALQEVNSIKGAAMQNSNSAFNGLGNSLMYAGSMMEGNPFANAQQNRQQNRIFAGFPQAQRTASIIK